MKEGHESISRRELPQPVGNVVVRSIYQVWVMIRLTSRNLVVSKRTLLVILLACVPIGIAVLLRNVMPPEGRRPANYELFTGLFVSLYVYFVVILTAIFYGTSLIADERSDRTITFLLIRPLPREAIIAGKFLTYAVSASAILVASLAVSYLVFSGTDQDVSAFLNTIPYWKCARVVVLGVVAYGALFTFFGAALKRPVIVAFAYCFIWESILPYLPVFLKKATLMYYILSLVPNWKSEGGLLEFVAEPSSPTNAVWTLVVVSVVFLILAAVSLRVKEYTFEKEV